MVKIFIDFDGTITKLDVGDAMFERFGGKQCARYIEQYRNETISAAECFRRECAACGDVDLEELNAFLDRQQIDATFPPFVRFCETAGHSVTVLSDGMDYYIARILAAHGLPNVSFFSNHLNLLPGKTPSRFYLEPEFPYGDEVCDRCACCKRNHMLSMAGDEDIIVFIGEGYSDRCPARYADVVFAKDELVRHCSEQNISFFEYQTFADVQRRLDRVMGGEGQLRKRRRAELERRAVFLGG